MRSKDNSRIYSDIIGTLLAGLKECGRSKDLDRGKSLHSAAIESGNLSNTHVSTAVVDMYAKCGSLVEARRVFDDNLLHAHDVVSWNVVIAAYAHNGKMHSALELFNCMQQHGCRPNARSFVAALTACANLASPESQQVEGIRFWCLQTGLRIHSQAAEESGRDHRSDVFLGTALLDLYAKCGSLIDARKTFDSMHSRDTVSWNAMIAGYVDNGENEMALEVFRRMKEEGVCRANERTFVAAVKACAKLAEEETGSSIDGKFLKQKCMARGMELHKEAAESGIRISEANYLGNSLVDLYAKCGSLVDARRVFECLATRDVVSWTAMVVGYAENGEDEEALKLFDELIMRGKEAAGLCLANHRTYVAALTACFHLAGKEKGSEVDGRIVKLNCLEKGMEIHSQACESDFQQEVFVGSSLIEMYARCGSLLDARRVFDELQLHDLVVWTALISGYVESGECLLALELFDRMQIEGNFDPDSRAFVAVIMACVRFAQQDDRQKTVILEKVKLLEDQITRSGFFAGMRKTFLANTMVDAYAKCGSLVDSRRVFERLLQQQQTDVVSWTVIILGHAHNGEADAALEFFARISCLESFCSPDEVVLAAALSACGSLVRLETGRCIQRQIHRLGLERCGELAACLVEFYGRCGEMVAAQQVFDSIVDTKQVSGWNSLMGGYAFQGNAARVFAAASEMRSAGVDLDEGSLVSVLSACSHAGLVERGKEIFSGMRSRYGVTPTARHYACMVDLLGRGNRLNEAVEMLERMPSKAGVLPWMSVLGACRKWQNAEVGEFAFRSVMEVDESRPAAYELIANIYASSS